MFAKARVMAQRPAVDSPHPLLGRRYRRRFIALMFLVCLFNFADRAVFAVLAQPIREALRLSDFELGILQGLSFAILYALLGLPIGRLAEHRSRIAIVSFSLAIWSAMTVASGLVGGFVQLMLARIGVGMGEAGFTAPTSSLVSDHFPRSLRASMMAAIQLGTPLGIFAGSLIGGAVGARFGWRAGFLVLGLPGLALAAAIPLLLREPSRGLADGLPPERGPPPDFGPSCASCAARRRCCA